MEEKSHAGGAIGSARAGLRLARIAAKQHGVIGRDVIGIRVQRRQTGDLDGEVADELLELLRPGDEVRLAVHLDEDAEAAARVDVAADQALAGVAVGLLGGRGEPALAQHAGRLLEVPVGVCRGRSCNP